ncbi:ATP-binding protein [Chloroflexota bacterium]
MRKPKYGRHHRPPWWNAEDKEHWGHHGPPMPWLRHGPARHKWQTGGGFLFLRFALFFGIFVLLGCGMLAVLAAGAMFLLRSAPGAELHPLRIVFGLLGVLALMALALRLVGSRVSRRVTSPLSDTMKAADALAAGNLAARVPEQGNGEFGHLARSFNVMAEALETADRQRRELLADVAHELRTPLTIIQGNLEGLRDGVYDATPDHVDLVLDETRKLSRLVDDLRLLTLAEAGQLPLDFQPLDVHLLLEDVCDAFSHQSEESDILLEVDSGESLPALFADSQRLGQVLGNLVANALRHTPSGGVVSLGAALQEGDGVMRLWVKDTGEGIPAEDIPRVFDRFWRGDPARTRGTGTGSGLGLAIAKSLVAAHGGRIWAESQVGEGTMVFFTIPLPPDP